MELDIEGVDNRFRHLDALVVDGLNEMGLNRQASLGFSFADVVEYQVKRPQGTALPGFADFAE